MNGLWVLFILMTTIIINIYDLSYLSKSNVNQCLFIYINNDKKHLVLTKQ